MGYASISGRARVNAKDPQAFGVCQRCNQWYNRVNLHWQFDWRGAALQNLYLLVCDSCTDVPQEQLRAIVVPADPLPVLFPVVEPFEQDETNVRVASAPTVYDPVTGIPIPPSVVRVTQDGECRTTQPIGIPVGLDPDAIMPLSGTTAYGVPLNVISVTSAGGALVTVTCGSVHGLSTGAQIAAEGLSEREANGMFSVIVTSATAFTYETNREVASGNLLTSTSRLVTANVGLPYGYAEIPLTGT